ncbi:MAG: putative sulfate exporter family transporter, partial [Bacteroides sp.]|nr:putative sulfate exporter family transporter [Bacteroides sp.]
MKKYTKQVYIALVVAISLLLLIDYLPNVDSYVSPPIALFLGLLFALLFGQAYPKFNKKVSKKLLQYSVVGLGFGMNLQA